MDLLHPRLPPLTKGESLATALERMILDGQLQPGERVPSERALAEQSGFSRGSVREALRDLAEKGLLQRKPGSGTIVQEFGTSPFRRSIRSGLDAKDAELVHVMEVRVCIEPPLAERAASRATRSDIAQLQTLVDDTRGVGTGVEFAALDRSFHLAIAQYTYNPLLVSLLDRAHELAALSRSERFLTRARIKSSVHEHQAIVNAISKRDSHAAFETAAVHITSVQERILEESRK